MWASQEKTSPTSETETARYREIRPGAPIEGVNLINATFKKFGMEMHIGRNGKASKTECMFVPPPGFFKRAELASTAPLPPALLRDSAETPAPATNSTAVTRAKRSKNRKKSVRKKRKELYIYKETAKLHREDFIYENCAETQRAM